MILGHSSSPNLISLPVSCFLIILNHILICNPNSTGTLNSNLKNLNLFSKIMLILALDPKPARTKIINTGILLITIPIIDILVNRLLSNKLVIDLIFSKHSSLSKRRPENPFFPENKKKLRATINRISGIPNSNVYPNKSDCQIIVCRDVVIATIVETNSYH